MPASPWQQGGIVSDAGIWKPAGYYFNNNSGAKLGPGSSWGNLSDGPDQVSSVLVPANGLLVASYRCEAALSGASANWLGGVRMVIDWGDGAGFVPVGTPAASGSISTVMVPTIQAESFGQSSVYTDGLAMKAITGAPAQVLMGLPLYILGQSVDRTVTVKMEYNPDVNSSGSQQIYAARRLLTCWTVGVTT